MPTSSRSSLQEEIELNESLSINFSHIYAKRSFQQKSAYVPAKSWRPYTQYASIYNLILYTL